jgi:hypothetical protein
MLLRRDVNPFLRELVEYLQAGLAVLKQERDGSEVRVRTSTDQGRIVGLWMWRVMEQAGCGDGLVTKIFEYAGIKVLETSG